MAAADTTRHDGGQTLRICLAGATGAVGRALAGAILDTPDMSLVAAVARGAAGRDIGEALGRAPLGLTIDATVAKALDDHAADVLIDYTHPTAIREHVSEALARGVAVVIGTSGLRPDDFAEIEAAAGKAGVGVATGNFCISAALMQHFAKIAARHLNDWEIVEYNKAAKPDVPSGTAIELAEVLGAARRPRAQVADDQGIGPFMAARGAEVGGARVHSVRLPGYAAACEVIFGSPFDRLSIRYDDLGAGESFVRGSLLAARAVAARPGLHRGLDSLLFAE